MIKVSRVAIKILRVSFPIQTNMISRTNQVHQGCRDGDKVTVVIILQATKIENHSRKSLSEAINKFLISGNLYIKNK